MIVYVLRTSIYLIFEHEVKTAGKIVYGKKVRLSEIYLEVEDKSQVRQEYNIDSKIEISYQ